MRTHRNPNMDALKPGSILCSQTVCRRFDCNIQIGNNALCRLKTDAGIFFFFLEQFDDLSETHLSPGDYVFIGGHALESGCAWAHWIKHESGRKWLTNREPWRLPCQGLLIGTLLIGGLWFNAPSSDWQLIVWMILGLTSLVILSTSLYKLYLRFHPTSLRLRFLLFQHERDSKTWVPTQPSPSINDCSEILLDNGVYGGVGIIQGKVDQAVLYKTEVSAYRNHISIRHYDLFCCGQRFEVITWSNAALGWKNPVLYRRPPLFIADGDRVTILTLTADSEVYGLLNLTQGVAYVHYGGSMFSPRHRHKLLTAILASAALVIAIISTIWWFEGVPKLLDIFTFGYFLANFMTALVLTVFLPLSYAFSRSSRNIIKRPAEDVIALSTSWRLHNGRSPQLVEL